MSLKTLTDIITRRLLGEPTPQRFTSVEGRPMIEITEIRLDPGGVSFMANDVEVMRATAARPFNVGTDIVVVRPTSSFFLELDINKI